MADTAFQTAYRQELINGFEATQSLLRMSVTTEAVIKGNEAKFLIVDSNGATATTRAYTGKIPSRMVNKTQVTCTLTEEHDKAIETGYNLHSSQGDIKSAMLRSTRAVINRRVDDQIIDQLNTGTVNTGTATVASMRLLTRVRTMLGNAKVPNDGMLTGVVTPAFLGYLLEMKEFANADYVSARPLMSGGGAWDDSAKIYQFMGINFITHPDLPGAGTSAEKCFFYHKSAIGHAMAVSDIQAFVGYNEEDDFTYCRTTFYGGAKLLQNSGVVVVNHDGSAVSA
jgi:hypothetical protein